MSEKITIFCDVCGISKNAGEFWLIASVTEMGQITFYRANIFARTEGAIDVCGNECAIKAFSTWLNTGKLKNGNHNS